MATRRIVLGVLSLALVAMLSACQCQVGVKPTGKDGGIGGLPAPGEDPAETALKPLNGKVKREGDSRDGPVIEVALHSPTVTDADLKQLAQFDRLRKVKISSQAKQVTGTGFASLAGLPLEDLDLMFTGVTDAGLKEIGKIKTLKVLDLLNCSNITDAGLPALAGLTNLEELRVGQNSSVMDVGVSKAIAGMPKLRKLDIGNSNVGDGALAQAAKTNPELRVLTCHASKVTDAGMKNVARLTHLEEFMSNRGRGMTDKGLAALSGLQELRTLDVGNSYVTFAGLMKSPLLSRLKVLKIGGPHQSDITPEQVEKLRAAAPNCNVIKD